MRFSIVMPVYNSERFIKKSVQSILNQSFNDWELILINDGSQDGSWEIIESFAERDERVRCFSQENKGVSRARNRGIELAQGDYVMFVDADDELCADALQIVANAIQSVPECDVVEFNVYWVNLCSEITGTVTAPFCDKTLVINTDSDKRKYVYSALASDKSFGLATNFAVRRKLITDIRFPTDMIICEDLVFDIQMYEAAQTVVCLPDFLYLYRNNTSGCVNTFNYKKIDDLKRAYEGKIRLMARYGLEGNRSRILYFFLASIMGFYSSVIEDGGLCREFCRLVKKDEYILARLKEYKSLSPDSSLRVSCVFGPLVTRWLWRWSLLLKRKARHVLKNMKR